MIDKCIYCGSINIYFSKKKNKYICEDCLSSFDEVKKNDEEIFFSYGHDENEAIVRKIRNDLKNRGHHVWYDRIELSHGDPWRRKISEAIQNSNHFISFLSKHSVRKPGVCLDEIAIAIGIKGCNINTILVEKDVNAPTSLNGIQWLDMSDWKKKKKQSETIWSKWYNEKLNSIIDVIESDKHKAFVGEITQIEEILLPVSFDTKLQLIMRQEIHGRDWLLEEIMSWYETDSKLFWIIGAPGSGKSFFAAKLAHYFPGIASIQFCEWERNDSLNPRNLIKSIAYQLACNISDYRQLLINILEDRRHQVINNSELFQHLITEPLNKLIDGNRRKEIILIDAIDELSGEHVNEFAEILAYNIKYFPRWISFIITSRPESGTLKPLKKYDYYEIELKSDKNLSDIFGYIKKELNQGIVSHNQDKLITRIVEKTDGIFIYANELIDSLNRGDLNIEDIDNYPKGMSGIYFEYFERKFTDINVFKQTYLPILELIVASREPLKIEFIKEILNDSADNIEKSLENLQSYFPILLDKGIKIVKPFHKSILEWLLSDEAGIFKVNTKKGHQKFVEHGLKHLLENKNQIDTYYVKHFITHYQMSGKWNLIDNDLKEKIISVLIVESKRVGLLDIEKKYIDLYKKYFNLIYPVRYLSYLLIYYTRAFPDKVENIADEMVEILGTNISDKSFFKPLMEIVTGYFYIGNNEKGLQVLNKFEKSNPELVLNNIKYRSEMNHSYGLIYHNIDKNKQVAKCSITAIKDYYSLDKEYDHIVSKINYFDALMGIGKLEESKEVAIELLKSIEEYESYIHVKDILNICYGNLLLTEGRVMESLEYYEKGLAQAKKIHQWDYNYGKIWRELSLSKIGDLDSLNNLYDIALQETKNGSHYLASLASIYLVLAAYNLNVKVDDLRFKRIEKIISKSKLPGHLLQLNIYKLLFFDNENINESRILEDTLNYLLECEGIKGEPKLIYDFYKKYKNKIEATEYSEKVRLWLIEYIEPIIKQRKAVEEAIISGLDNEVILSDFNCSNCDGRCCYDGVYVNEAEELKIKKLMNMYPEAFDKIESPVFIDDDWKGLIKGRKTNTRTYSNFKNDFPKHFKKTLCIFSVENKCLLQKVATDNDLSPWKYKPQSCWLFPLRIENNNVQAPYNKNNDPFILEKYNGYVSAVGCTEVLNKGTDWKTKYLREIEYYKLIKQKVNSEKI